MKNTSPIQKLGAGIFILAFVLFTLTPLLSSYKMTDMAFQQTAKFLKGQDSLHHYYLTGEFSEIVSSQKSMNKFEWSKELNAAISRANEKLPDNKQIAKYYKQEYRLKISHYALAGLPAEKKSLWFFLTFGAAIIGGLMYILPKFWQGEPGIKNDHTFHSSLKSWGWLGILLGSWMIAFYIVLYFMPYLVVEWVALVDPLSLALKGQIASQWFVYGFMYTIAVIVMGIRMFAKYRHSKYHLVRTCSVMFFQLGFAFLLPEIMASLSMPAYDLKNIWPLDYSFFYDWRVNDYMSSGAIGMLMFIFGIALIVIGVPLMTFFFGKRWYCSWVCGCGGLAETLGDPFRHQSDNSLRAWKIERYLVHGVLVFAVVMTVLVLITTITGGFGFSYTVRSIYGFLISSIFAGVVGTGFYPLMGNRVWCRFGCPLAAYLGIIQRFRSKFRITTNGGQCISCGNCSTYCEMGIDVRWYAQRGQDIVRASCVGCGVCSSVCPRGVLSLENGPEDSRKTEAPIQITGSGFHVIE